MSEEAEVVTTQTINIAPDPMGTWRWIQTMNERTMSKEATIEAVKLWWLTIMLPFAKGGDLLNIVRGELDMEEFLKEYACEPWEESK